MEGRQIERTRDPLRVATPLSAFEEVSVARSSLLATSLVHRPRRPWSAGFGVAAAAVAGALVAAGAAAQARPAPLPFAPGEACTYRGSGPLGRMGSGTFAVERDEAAGAGSWLLRFDFRGRVGLLRVENHTRSWFDPAETASVRFTKNERSPFSTRREDVHMDRAARRWTGMKDEPGGAMPTGAPLDELSFIFFLRTLRLDDGDHYSFTRHYDTSRNPIVVRVLGRGTVKVPAGRFRTVQVEMRVRDPHQYGGEGVILIHFTDDAHHVPLRIDSRIPRAGHVTLALEALSATCGAAPPATHAVD
ncbi:MAG: hypothetical protein JWM27_2998 [Gemmatimonadetes bacterium]|nr:hypothetical protein [Gemmatimonadota bacterium]